ncbi:MAG: tripartite ATP-independent transporter DctP family solute receptor [Algoriphagus sp.]|jgi:tripartite ATP-independent transporter DctP family solute receptor
MKSKKISRSLPSIWPERFLMSFCLGLFCLSLTQCQNEQDPEHIIRASMAFNEQHTWYKAFVYFGELLEERSDGRIKLEVYPSEQLAKEMETIRLIQAEVVEMTATGSSLSNWIEIAAFCELPFLVQSYEELESLINGPIGKRIEKEMIEKTGLRPVTYFVRGPRQLTSNRPIRHPDDLQGLILRIPNVPSYVTAWSAMGAKPTPMALSEVFTGLQQGTIEGLENPFALILNAGFAEVQDYVNVTEHVMSWAYPVIGEKQFQKLPDDLKTIFLEAAKDMQTYERGLFEANEKDVKEALKAKGMEFIEVDKAAFAAKCKKAIYESLSPEMKLVYQEIIDARTPK